MKKLPIVIIAALALMATTARAAEAKDNFVKYCKSCHGLEGKGDTPLGQKFKVRDYSDPAVQGTLKDEEMFKAIKEGNEKNHMKPMADKMTDDEIKALGTYLRGLKKK
jgi:cytochrome c553